MALSTFALSAQDNSSERTQQKKELRNTYTPEERAELFTKRMTSKLDLNMSQQKEIKRMYMEMGENKASFAKNRKEMTSQERFDAKNERLRRRIAMREQLKNILNAEQLEKLEKAQHTQRSYHEKRRVHTRQKEE